MSDATTQISLVTQDYLKAIWQATEWGGEPATTSALAARFGTSPANVSDLLSRLDRAGLVARQPYRPVTLTERGTQLALSMVRRHRLIETYLVEALGYACTEVHDDAELLEHAASETFIERLAAHLGHPSVDPHGDPIPGPDGRLSYPDNVFRATEVSAGRYVVARISDADHDLLVALHDQDIHPGDEVEIGDQMISRAGTRSTLGSAALEVVWVFDDSE